MSWLQWAFLVLLMFPGVSSAAELQCPDVSPADALAKPAIVMRLDNQKTLMVCGFQEKEIADQFSEFAVYSVGSTGEIERKLFEADAFHSFRVQQIKQGFQLTELLYLNKKYVPIFESRITCNKKSCEPSREGCIYKSKRFDDPDALAELESYMTGKNKEKAPDEAKISAVANLAYSGDKRAQKVFFKRADDLKLDGAATEEFDSARTMLSRLKEAKCLP